MADEHCGTAGRGKALQTIPILATLSVGRRTYRKASGTNRRRMLEYEHPELRLSNRWLARAGLKPGDRVYITNPKRGCLVILPAPPLSESGSPQAGT